MFTLLCNHHHRPSLGLPVLPTRPPTPCPRDPRPRPSTAPGPRPAAVSGLVTVGTSHSEGSSGFLRAAARQGFVPF